MAETKYYAVNDKPLLVKPMPDGGEELFAFDWKTGNFVVDRSYFDALVPGSGKDVDALSVQQFDALLVKRRVDLLRMWCERMCALANGTKPELEGLIGMPAEPLPLGARDIKIDADDIGIASITLHLHAGVVRRADVERRFGEPTVVPKVNAAFLHRFSYAVKAPGAQHGCSLFVSTQPDAPQPDAWVAALTLRLDRYQGAR